MYAILLRRIKWGQDHAAYQLDEQRRLQNEADGGQEDVGEEEDEERAPLRHSKFPMTCSLLWEGASKTQDVICQILAASSKL